MEKGAFSRFLIFLVDVTDRSNLTQIFQLNKASLSNITSTFINQSIW